MTDFNTAATAAMLQSPFFGQLLMKMKHVSTTEIPTLAVSHNTIFYNPNFLDKLTPEEGVFGVCHELMHVAWMHLPRMKYYHDNGIGPDGKPYSNEKMNIAADFAVNDALRVSGFTIPRKDVINICLDPNKYPYTMTPEEIYCAMPEPPEGMSSMDGHNSDGEPDPLDPNTVTAADVIRAGELAKAVGSLPAGIDRLLGELRRPDSSPWNRLRRMVKNSLRGYDTTSWRRLNRTMLARGVGMPGPVANGAGRIGVVGDTSGSIGQEMLELFGRHLCAIRDDAKPQEVRIYWTDTRVNQIDVVKTSADLRRVFQNPIKGGGGTDMPVGVQAAIEDKCDCVIVLTDGYTPFGHPQKTPVIWAITEAGIRPPHGQHVHIAG